MDADDSMSKIDDHILDIVSKADSRISNEAIDNNGGVNNYAKDVASYLQTRVVGALNRFLNPFDMLHRLSQENQHLLEQLIALHQLKLNGKESLSMLKTFRDESSNRWF